jgi:hypothetical protein
MANGDQTHRVTLGCGTLILIALIVLFFSRSGSEELKGEVGRLRSDIAELKTTVEAQTRKIESLEARLKQVAESR